MRRRGSAFSRTCSLVIHIPSHLLLEYGRCGGGMGANELAHHQHPFSAFKRKVQKAEKRSRVVTCLMWRKSSAYFLPRLHTRRRRHSIYAIPAGWRDKTTIARSGMKAFMGRKLHSLRCLACDGIFQKLYVGVMNVFNILFKNPLLK